MFSVRFALSSVAILQHAYTYTRVDGPFNTCFLLGLFLLALAVAILHAHYALLATKIGMMARIMTTSAVYHKVGRPSVAIKVAAKPLLSLH